LTFESDETIAMKKTGLILTLSLLVAVCAVAQEQDTGPLYKKVLPSVMKLLVEKKDGSKHIGTGFLAIKNGLAVTAWHLVRDAAKVQVKFSNGEIFDSSGLIDKDESRDIAIIKVKVFGRPTLELQSADPEVGSQAFVVGAPEGLESSISDGLISQIQNIDGIRYYQYTCPTSHGNSGGPLLNLKGSVVGVISWGLTKGQNLNFAIPCSYVLGLDTSLATTEWAAVKSSELANPVTKPKAESLGTKLPDEEFDKELFSAKEAIINGMVAISYTYEFIVTKRSGFKNGVPAELYARQTKLLSFKESLLSYRSDNATREAYRKTTQAEATIVSYAIRQLMEGIKLAQMDEGWTDRASDILRQSQATMRGADDAKFDEAQKAFLALDDVRERCPERLRRFLGITKDKSGFVLGIEGFTDFDDRYLMIVNKKSLAEKLGFRSGDTLKEMNGKPIASLMAFKEELARNLNKKVKVTIEREDKKKKLEFQVPKDLSKT
jgi:S1-C subfamily serine protease